MKGIEIFVVSQIPPTPRGSKATYRCISRGTTWGLVMNQDAPPGFASEPHKHPVPELFLVHSGLLRICGEDGNTVLTPNMGAEVSPDVPHWVKNETGAPTSTMILLGEGYRDEDKITFEEGGPIPESR